MTSTETVELSERELQVLRGMAQGQSNSDIGRSIHISEDTVKSHARTLYRKLGATDRAHAVALAYQHRVLTPESDEIARFERTPARLAAPPRPVVPHPTPGAQLVTLEVSDRGALRLARAVYDKHYGAPWAFERCSTALRRLAGQVTT